MSALKFTKEPEWLNKWDVFLNENKKGSHLILSEWLKSYKSYGFDYEIGILIENGKIVGGYGAVIPKFLVFKFYIIPHGIIYAQNYEPCLKEHILEIKNRAKNLGCCYLQLSIPKSSNSKIIEQTFNPNDFLFLQTIFEEGKLFKYIYTSYGLNWIDFKGIADEDDLLKEMKSHGRRNIRTAHKNNLVLAEANTESTIKEAYKLIELNAIAGGYKVRQYSEIKQTLSHLIQKDMGVFLVAYKDNVIKGSAFFVKNIHSYTYIFGGTIKEKPDYKIGYLLHWEAIKRAFNNKCLGYNISMGGSKGVQRFKQQFGAEEIFYESPNYYVIINKFYFAMFKFFNTYLKPYKSQFSKLLARVKR